MRVNRDAAGIVLLLALSALFLYLSYLLFRPYASPILFALVIAVVFQPLHVYISRRIRTQSLAALCSMSLAMAFVAVPLLLLGFALSHELSDLYRSMASRGSSTPVTHAFGLLQGLADWFTGKLSVPRIDVYSSIMRRLGEASATFVGLGASIIGNLVTWITDAVIAALVLFFLFRDGEVWLEKLSSSLPFSEQRFTDLRRRISSTVTANFYGGVAVGAAQGTLTALSFWALGLQSPILWGVVTAFMSLMPVVGSAAVWVPASLLLLFSGHLVKGIILLALGAGVIGIADNIVRPLIISESVRLHTIYVLFALLGGVQVFGPIGLFVGPVILSVTAALLAMVREDFQDLTKAARAAGGTRTTSASVHDE
jgi:predicted PurR-regulated permease PerM